MGVLVPCSNCKKSHAILSQVHSSRRGDQAVKQIPVDSNNSGRWVHTSHFFASIIKENTHLLITCSSRLHNCK